MDGLTDLMNLSHPSTYCSYIHCIIFLALCGSSYERYSSQSCSLSCHLAGLYHLCFCQISLPYFWCFQRLIVLIFFFFFWNCETAASVRRFLNDDPVRVDFICKCLLCEPRSCHHFQTGTLSGVVFILSSVLHWRNIILHHDHSFLGQHMVMLLGLDYWSGLSLECSSLLLVFLISHSCWLSCSFVKWKWHLW